VDAQASVLNAESTLVSVRAEIAVADVALRATMGMLDPRVDLAPTAPAEAP
jgi:outer membrane protein TolC